MNTSKSDACRVCQLIDKIKKRADATASGGDQHRKAAFAGHFAGKSARRIGVVGKVEECLGIGLVSGYGSGRKSGGYGVGMVKRCCMGRILSKGCAKDKAGGVTKQGTEEKKQAFRNHFWPGMV